MKGSVIALDEIGGARAAARLVDGRLEDLLVDADVEDGTPRPGALYRAICDRPVKGQGGMFVRLPECSGFLRGARGLKPGQALLVQVTSQAEAGKAVPVTERVLFKSRFAIVTPGAPGVNVSRRIRDEEARVRLKELAAEVMGDQPVGLILRSEAEAGTEAAIAEDIAAMRELAAAVLGDAEGRDPELLVEGPDAHALAWRDWPAPDDLADAPGSFASHGIDEMIAALRTPRLSLSGGAFAYIEPTRALVAVDVNTGPDTSPAAGLKANIAFARDLPRQLRCRGLGGQIVVDFAPMPKKDRRALEQVLRAAFKADPVETALAGWTPLGLYELQRKRERRPLGGGRP